MFETDKDVLDRYERQPRALTKDFVDRIPWREISNYALNASFIPVLIYLRDVEYFTDIYYREQIPFCYGCDPIEKQKGIKPGEEVQLNAWWRSLSMGKKYNR